jgi:copper/silver efflux system protein
MTDDTHRAERRSFTGAIIYFCLTNKLVVLLLITAALLAGLMTAPFDWDIDWLPRNPVAVDAIPDIGENQQIVFTEWMGRSPQDIEDQITYPLTVSLLGIPGVRTVRSYSFFGFSSIYIIFEEDIEFYWSRSRVLEKLSSLPPDMLPDGVMPMLGPDSTSLGQIYQYTIEGRDPEGNPVGGWDLHELRSVQDWYVRYALLGAGGISEVSSIGGFVQEYQIDVDPDALRAFDVSLPEIFDAVRMSNVDVGARTIEINRVEYVIRGLGFIRTLDDIRNTVVAVRENVPVRIQDLGVVALGPALRRGALDKEGAEAVGGIVVVRYGENPLAAIKNIKSKIAEIAPGMPTKPVIDYGLVTMAGVSEFASAAGFHAYEGTKLNEEAWLAWLNTAPRADWPAWITTSKLHVVPFYDRTGLIYETLGTLETALIEQILITIIVVLVMVRHLRSAIVISGLLPLAVLMCFIAMRYAGVDANIVALSGIAIAIGTMVDMGVIMTENILKHLDEAHPDESRLDVIYRASNEVGSAVLTAMATTVVSFLPVFTMIGAEGKLFRPLAFTKTFALIASIIVALTIIPPVAHVVLGRRMPAAQGKQWAMAGLVIGGILSGIFVSWWVAVLLIVIGLFGLAQPYLPPRIVTASPMLATGLVVLVVTLYLTQHWMPLGPQLGLVRNLVFVVVIIGALLGFFELFQRVYTPMLRYFLAHKLVYLSIPAVIIFFGVMAWLGVNRIFAFVPEPIRETRVWTAAAGAFPGFGKEFMPPLDEGSYLFMPTTMPHASIGEALEVLQLQDMAIRAIPEVETVVGKIGRADSPMDPAPISMVETIIDYKSEFKSDEAGHTLTFAYDEEAGEFLRNDRGELIADRRGRPYRQWRDHIRTPDDIWDEIVKAGTIPGSTSAPRLQPIAARVVMLQSGMRAPMGLKVRGPDLETIERVGLDLERLLKEVPSIEPSAVIADRIVGKPYLEIDIDREAIARYGMNIRMVQDVIEVAIGGNTITTTVEGRERYPVRVRYMRELRDDIESIGRVLVPGMDGTHIPLAQLAEIRFVRGPQAIKSEDTFLVGYVLLDKKPGFAEVDVVEEAQAYLEAKIASGELVLPAGVSYAFSGSYENQVRAAKTLSVVLPLALFIIFIILYLQFRSVITTGLVFSGIFLAWSGGFVFIWLYAQPWFLDFSVLGMNLRELFGVRPINMSVAIWVGFLALFGIASDDGVVMATYLRQSFTRLKLDSVAAIREATVVAGQRRIRPCLMTTATTVLALIPILTSTGRGSDVMIPMAIPAFGGMLIEVVTLFLVPVLYCWFAELRLRLGYMRPEEATGAEVPEPVE